jgi:hypothetical protein
MMTESKFQSGKARPRSVRASETWPAITSVRQVSPSGHAAIRARSSNRARQNLDRHPNYSLTAYMASGTSTLDYAELRIPLRLQMWTLTEAWGYRRDPGS